MLISPMLAKPANKPLSFYNTPDYTVEPKLDGIRCIATVDNGVTLQSRPGRNITATFPEIPPSLLHLQGYILDGELIAANQAVESYQDIQTRTTRVHDIDAQVPVEYVVFDVIQTPAQGLVFELPYIVRRDILRQLEFGPSARLIPAGYDDPEAEFGYAQALGREGLIVKNNMSPYEFGRRTSSWIKFKCTKEGWYTVVGATIGHGKRAPYFGALVLMNAQGKHVGEVGTGYTDSDLERITGWINAHKTARNPLSDYCPSNPYSLILTWCSPLARVRVKYLELTNDGKLRHPSVVEYQLP